MTNSEPLDLQVEFMWKTGNSVTGNCPAMYRTSHEGQDGYLIQGKIVSAATLARLRDLGDDEGAVFVPADVVNKITGRL